MCRCGCAQAPGPHGHHTAPAGPTWGGPGVPKHGAASWWGQTSLQETKRTGRGLGPWPACAHAPGPAPPPAQPRPLGTLTEAHSAPGARPCSCTWPLKPRTQWPPALHPLHGPALFPLCPTRTSRALTWMLLTLPKAGLALVLSSREGPWNTPSPGVPLWPWAMPDSPGSGGLGGLWAAGRQIDFWRS